MPKTTFQLVRAIVATMHIRVHTEGSDDETRGRIVKTCSELLTEAKGHPAASEPVVSQLVEALDMQEKRQAGEFHLSHDSARHIWDSAVTAGEAFLQQSANPVPA
jgi:hypothetical protein